MLTTLSATACHKYLVRPHYFTHQFASRDAGVERVEWSETAWSGKEWSGVGWSGVERREEAWSGEKRSWVGVQKSLVQAASDSPRDGAQG